MTEAKNLQYIDRLTGEVYDAIDFGCNGEFIHVPTESGMEWHQVVINHGICYGVRYSDRKMIYKWISSDNREYPISAMVHCWFIPTESGLLEVGILPRDISKLHYSNIGAYDNWEYITRIN